MTTKTFLAFGRGEAWSNNFLASDKACSRLGSPEGREMELKYVFIWGRIQEILKLCHFRFIYVIKAGKFLEILDISNGKKLLIKYQSASMAANISLRAMNFIYSFIWAHEDSMVPKRNQKDT